MIKPLYNNVLVEKCKEETTTTSGIILTTQKPKDEAWATVVAAGSGTEIDGKTTTIPVKPGDKVLLKKYVGTEVKYANKDYILIDAEERLAVID